MVRAKRDRAEIRAALVAGDFYASSGVLLDRLEMNTRSIEISVASPGSHAFELIGTGGAVLKRVEGRTARFELAADSKGYVRVRITGERGRAWTQPVYF